MELNIFVVNTPDSIQETPMPLPSMEKKPDKHKQEMLKEIRKMRMELRDMPKRMPKPVNKTIRQTVLQKALKQDDSKMTKLLERLAMSMPNTSHAGGGV